MWLIFQIAILLILTAFVFTFGSVFFFGAPFAPSKKSAIRIMLSFAEIKEGDIVAELGSGDGRLVIALAQAGAEVHGYEINPFLVAFSRWRIRRAGLQHRATIHRTSYWGDSFKKYTIVCIFGAPHIMRRLAKKLTEELQPGTKVICNTYKLPKWNIKKEYAKIYLYVLGG